MKVLTDVSIERRKLSSPHACTTTTREIQEHDGREKHLNQLPRHKKIKKTHIITNPLKRAKSPAFASQKLLTHACMHTITTTPTAGITIALDSTLTMKGEYG